ncbi:CHAT domain-containing protein [Cellulomonas cellasea]|uniref:CHAT domain-containing protein n=2 Tax=Cellulomonas cellasea TaxID=43670 RepID=A0A0A0BF94_9CELL|nr:CHAT domain-containing protein [Cellulomonas cellasea]KGM03986.1 hypothetical protein Q760_00100 [Cellulomonas cellasea DSM 20118]GEA89051.1 hypothetical protein CCE01nite_30000 [Cellulomonas cellasea]
MNPQNPDAADYRSRIRHALDSDDPLEGLIEEGEALLARVDAVAVPDVCLDVALVRAHRYERADDDADLQRAIVILRRGVASCGTGSWSAVPLLVNLGTALLRSFERHAQMSDLAEAIDCLVTARGVEGDFSSRSPVIHSSLGSALFRQAQATGGAEARDASISLLERAMQAASPGSAEWTQRQLNLCNPLFLRAEQGDQAALDRILRAADDLLPSADPSSTFEADILLVSSRACRLAFEWSDEVRYLHRALADYQQLLTHGDLTPNVAALARANYANALRAEYEVTGGVESLEEACEQLTAALDLLAGRPAEALKQSANLAKVLARRFEAMGDVADLRAAIRLHEEVVEAGSLGEHTLRVESKANLGTALLTLGRRTHDARATESGLATLAAALSEIEEVQDPGLVLAMGVLLGEHHLSTGRPDLAAGALRRALLALDQADVLSTGSSSRHRLLRRGAHAVQLAALALVRTGHPEDAVLVIEQGRARAVADALKLDVAAVDDLAASGSLQLASAYASTARELRAASHRLTGPQPERAVAEIRAHRGRLDALTRSIREVEGFEDFARPVDGATIRRAAGAAPLVYGCVTDFGSALLIVSGDGSVDVLDLPKLKHATVERLASEYLGALASLRGEHGVLDDVADVEKRWADALDTLTRWMGAAFMTRLCAVLAERHVTRAVLLLPGWLNLLPVSAARLSTGERTAVDALAWCYAPSAAALAGASAVAASSTARSAVLVGDPESSGVEPLASAAAEVDGARAAFSRTTVLRGSQATRDAVRGSLSLHDVAHFACHGLTDRADPLRSALLLAGDEQLTLGDLLHHRVSRMRLCVLSACDTAVVGEQAPDEYVSLPTGLVQAGAAGVIAAQWPVWDVAAAVLSIRLYAEWPREDPDPVSAFHDAQLWLRNATRREVERLVERQVSAVARGPLLDGLRHVGLDVRPFHDTQDWAAFAYVGC